MATALALLLLRPLYFLLSVNASARELFTLGRLLAVVLVLVAVKMFLLGAAANGVTHLGPIPLPAGIAASVWISLLLAVLVTSAAIRVALRRRRDRHAATSSV